MILLKYIKSLLCPKPFNGLPFLSKSQNSLNGPQGPRGLILHYTTNLISQGPLPTLGSSPCLLADPGTHQACLNLLSLLPGTLASDSFINISGLSLISPYQWGFPWSSFKKATSLRPFQALFILRLHFSLLFLPPSKIVQFCLYVYSKSPQSKMSAQDSKDLYFIDCFNLTV